MRGVILDEASLGPTDIDISVVLRTAEHWQRHAQSSPEQVPERISDAEIVLSNKVWVGREAMQSAAHLRLIVVTATGTNNIDLAAARERGIAVCNVRGYAGASVAQHTMMLILALARNLIGYRNAVTAGAWSRSPFFCLHDYPIADLSDRNLAIIGYGELGRGVAKLAEAFGMHIALARMPGRDYRADEQYPRLPIDDLLRWADVVSIHCPLTDQTRALIGARQFGLMRSHALLINTARGGIIEERALLDALQSATIGGAALDTLYAEPPAADHPLLTANLANLIITPHVAWASREARQRLVNQVGDILAAFRRGEFMNRVA